VSGGGTVTRRLLELLAASGCDFELLEHASARGAAEAAAARGTPLDLGTKAILFKYGGAFGVFALSAERALSSAAVRRHLHVQRTRFATARELDELTGLVPGEVPPFGEPVLPFPVFADPSVIERESMLFTAGSRRLSVRLRAVDYQRLARPQVVPFAR
jgi:Ala-tRNA(Pro) deacylase